ncbi:hypothetical protein BGZ94_001900 [Podila epigama]|nr:hypothetical protein BGZ94_001900 [Podila epigama]
MQNTINSNQSCTSSSTTLVNDFESPSPLRIEEILVEIVSYLNRSSLHSCVQVSKIWYRASIRYLWAIVQWKSPSWASSFLPEFKRYGHYAVELQDNFKADLELIASVCNNLRELRLTWTSPTDAALHKVLLASPNITTLSLSSCRFLTQDSFAAISQLCSLQSLDLSNLTLVDEQSIVMLARACPLLEHLVFTDVRLDEILLDSLDMALFHLSTLRIVRSNPTGNLVQHLIQNTTRLTELSLARNLRMSLTVQQVLSFRDRLGHITLLNLESCKMITAEAFEILVHASPELERLNVSGTVIGDACLDVLPQLCPKIFSLNMSACPAISDQTLGRFLRSHAGLRYLNISSPEFYSAAIFDDPPWACTDLETLLMNGLDMTGPHYAPQENHSLMFLQLSRLSKLQDLSLGGPFMDLRLSAGMERLEGLESLCSIRITQLQTSLAEDEIRWIIEAWPKLKRAKFDHDILPRPWLRYFHRQRPHLVLG